MSAIALGLDRTVLELKMYSREKEAVFFSFLFPILLSALSARPTEASTSATSRGCE